MTTLCTVPFSIAVAVIFCFLISPPQPAAAGQRKTELATEICKNTTDFAFCREVVYSDPRAPSADRVVLAYIAFGKASSNATATQDFIASKIKSIGASGRNRDVLRGLRKCLGYYHQADRALTEVRANLDDESFYEFDKSSLNVGNQSLACEASFRRGRSPLTKRNGDLTKLANICYVVSLLFPYA